MGDIKRLRQKVNFLERESKGKLRLKKNHKLNELNERYRVKRKGLKTVMLARSTKVRRYEQRIEKFRKNGIFDFHQKM